MASDSCESSSEALEVEDHQPLGRSHRAGSPPQNAGARRAPLVRVSEPERQESSTATRTSTGAARQPLLHRLQRQRRLAQPQRAVLRVPRVVEEEGGALAPGRGVARPPLQLSQRHQHRVRRVVQQQHRVGGLHAAQPHQHVVQALRVVLRVEQGPRTVAALVVAHEERETAQGPGRLQRQRPPAAAPAVSRLRSNRAAGLCASASRFQERAMKLLSGDVDGTDVEELALGLAKANARLPDDLADRHRAIDDHNHPLQPLAGELQAVRQVLGLPARESASDSPAWG